MNNLSEGIETLVREITPGAEVVSRKKTDLVDEDDEIERLGDQIEDLEKQLSEQIALVRSRVYVDGLTGIGNRAAYEEHVEQLKDEIADGTADFTVAVFDLNGLKEINDNYGHEKGDEAIIHAARLLERIYPNAKLYRIGGDEFVTILDGSHPELLLRLQDTAENDSLSKGAAVYDPSMDHEYRAVFARADQAMYEDKREYYRVHPDRRRRGALSAVSA